MKRMPGQSSILACFVWLGLVSVLQAANPWDSLLTLKRVEADPEKSYGLSEDNGPWMIMACSFSGEIAQEQARELVLELRKRYKLPAYSYEKTFELGNPVGLGVDKFGDPLRLKYRHGSEISEVAVLVGDYASVDDPEAQKALSRLKYTTPDCLKLKKDRPTSRTLAAWRTMQQLALAAGNEKKEKGPMAHALLTTNPLLPKDFFVSPGLDPLVIASNEGVTFSLLDCPGQYTVQVATYTGKVVIDQREIQAIKTKRKSFESGGLVEAAEKAHKLTEALRHKGYEAYEFHDRQASVVTVGSFEWATRRDASGREQLNPAIKEIMDRFGPRQTNLGGATGGLAQQMLVGLPFDMRPLPVHVPKQSFGTAHNRTATGMF